MEGASTRCGGAARWSEFGPASLEDAADSFTAALQQKLPEMYICIKNETGRMSALTVEHIMSSRFKPWPVNWMDALSGSRTWRMDALSESRTWESVLTIVLYEYFSLLPSNPFFSTGSYSYSKSGEMVHDPIPRCRDYTIEKIAIPRSNRGQTQNSMDKSAEKNAAATIVNEVALVQVICAYLRGNIV